MVARYLSAHKGGQGWTNACDNLLQRLLGNIFENAVMYMHEGGVFVVARSRLSR